MLTVWRKADLFDASKARAATWIFTIARNRRLDMLRRDAPQLERALQHQRAEPDETMGSLGEVLLRDNVVDKARLTAALRRQVMAALEEMLRWGEGAFSFHPALEEELPPIAMDLQEVMMKLMRLSDERNAGRPVRPE